MNFKDSYKRDNEKIVPDPEFISDLEKKLEIMSSQEIKRRKNISVAFKICSSCAAAVILTVGITLGVRRSSGSIDNPMHQAGKQTGAGSAVFSQSDWYDSGMTCSEIYEVFINRMADSSDLSLLYRSSSNTFTDEDLMNDKDEIKSLVKSYSRVTVSDKDEKDLNNAVYYMAQFENGDIIKFIIYDGMYVKIKNIDAVFSL
ncbi:MAG: hypothetical protein Q4F95_01155 [Oscillospiraceae bacterium]|nr:hypothetical protein [Oscillospiraceae bacterium]